MCVCLCQEPALSVYLNHESLHMPGLLRGAACDAQQVACYALHACVCHTQCTQCQPLGRHTRTWGYSFEKKKEGGGREGEREREVALFCCCCVVFITAGATVQIVSFGGSVTSGYWDGSTNPGWIDQLLPWLHQAFPTVTFKLLNLARGSSGVLPAAVCWYQYMPQDADLVFIEYSVNGCTSFGCTSWSAPLVSSVCLHGWCCMERSLRLTVSALRWHKSAVCIRHAAVVARTNTSATL